MRTRIIDANGKINDHAWGDEMAAREEYSIFRSNGASVGNYSRLW